MLLKEGGGRHFQKESRSDGKERLNFLLKQTELFTNFIVQSRNMKGAKKQQDLQQVQKNMIMSMRQMGGKGTSRRGNKKATRNFGEGGDAADADDGNFTITRLTTQPSILQAVTLRDYQLDSLNWMIGLYETGINGILADEMVSISYSSLIPLLIIGPGKDDTSDISPLLPSRIQTSQELFPDHCAKSGHSSLEEGVQESLPGDQSAQPDRHESRERGDLENGVLAREVRCLPDHIRGRAHMHDSMPQIQMGVHHCRRSTQDQERREPNL